jgi:tol-pal system protein YbgF
MQTRPATFRTTLAALVAAAALAACSSVKLDEPAPVESRSGAAVGSAGTGAGAGGAGSTAPGSQTRVAPVDATAGSRAQLSDAQRIVYFDYDSYVVRDDARPVIEANARMLAGDRARRMAVEGHTDARGSSEYNLALGQRRAEAVVRSLTLLGAPADPARGGELRQGAPGRDGRRRVGPRQEPARRAEREMTGRATGARALALSFALAASAATAGLFDDDEARRAILDLRQRIEQGNEATRRSQAEQERTQRELVQQLEQLRRSLLDLNGQIEQQRAENARMRGQMEQLARDVSEQQRKVADISQGVDDRIRRFEPQKVTIDDREFSVDPEEKRQYDEALAGFRRGDYPAASTGFAGLLRRFPASGYREAALFWLGNAQYAVKDYKEAITTFRSLVAAAPQGSRAPEAMLAIANCQAELKDRVAARKTLDDLVKTYPRSEAAQAGKERLAALR